METAFAYSLLMEGAAAAAIPQLHSVAMQRVTWRSLATTLLQEPDNPLNLSLPPSPHTLPCFYLFFGFSILLYIYSSKKCIRPFIFSREASSLTDKSLPYPPALDKCLLICAMGHLHKCRFEGCSI